MQFKIRFPIKVPKREFKVNKFFKTKSKITKRTIEISEAFGIGIDEEKQFVVFKDFAVDINPSDIVYISGDSGGGKSVLLRELKAQILKTKEFGKVVSADEIKIDGKQILIEGVGNDTNSAVNILSQAGLNEAFLMLRRYKELSDGQKYRHRIAKMIDSGADTWFFDEFLATLDRITAKVVAYCVQKIARRLGKTVIIATTHKDLFEDLNPSVYVEKGFGDSAKVERYQSQNNPCSLLSEIVIEKGIREDYRRLEEFHYRQKMPSIIYHVFRARLHDEVIGAICYIPSHPNLRARSLCLSQFKGSSTAEHVRMINQTFVRIGRVVVHPKFRTIGLGVKLVKDTLSLVDRPYVETLAVMAQYNPFFEKAGMVRIPYSIDESYLRRLEELKEMGFSIELLSSRSHNLKVIQKLSITQLEKLRKILLGYFLDEKYRMDTVLKQMVIGNDKEAFAITLTKHRLKPEYLIWKNPDSKFKDSPNPILDFRDETIDSTKVSLPTYE
jgi:ABC-type ATPase with predicted acetyltransferase domain